MEQNLQLPVSIWKIIPTCCHRNKGEVEYIKCYEIRFQKKTLEISKVTCYFSMGVCGTALPRNRRLLSESRWLFSKVMEGCTYMKDLVCTNIGTFHRNEKFLLSNVMQDIQFQKNQFKFQRLHVIQWTYIGHDEVDIKAGVRSCSCFASNVM